MIMDSFFFLHDPSSPRSLPFGPYNTSYIAHSLRPKPFGTSYSPIPLGVITKVPLNLNGRAEMKNIDENGKYRYGGERNA